ncbi:DHH family phosphoesterase [bacterium]|nr:DHH family phosphoesterase [bacterium]
MKEILVTCYQNPDLDGFSCAIAYAEFLNKIGNKAKTFIQGNPTLEIKFLMSYFNFNFPVEVKNSNDYESIALTDSSDLNALGGLDPKKVVEVIDHRKYCVKELFPNAKFQVELVGAAATLVAEKFKENNIELSHQSGILLYGAVYSNTLNLKSNTTTDRDRIIAKWLKNKFNIEKDLIQKMFLAKSNLKGELLGKGIRNDFAYFKETNIGVAQLEIFNAQELIGDRKEEIISCLNILRKEFKIDLIFISIIDLKIDQNFFIATGKKEKEILEKILKIKFKNNVAIRKGLIMRKEIIPLLVKELE